MHLKPRTLAKHLAVSQNINLYMACKFYCVSIHKRTGDVHLSKACDCMYVEPLCKIHGCPEWTEDYGKMEKRHRVSVSVGGYKVSLDSDANVLKWIVTLA